MSDAEKQQEDLMTEALRLLGNQYDANAAFNEYFDGEEPLTVQSPREQVGAYQYERSKVLYWVDREAYDDERAAWDNKSLQEQHQDAVALLKANGHVGPFRDLVDAVARQRAVPFIGAGLSKPMDMPLWSEALREIHNRVHSPNHTAITKLIDQGRLLEAAQALVEHNQTLADNYIRTTYRVRKLAGPIRLLPRIAPGCIVTTNFDDAIEAVFREGKTTFDGHMYGQEEHNFFSRLVRGQRCLLKLHGDADNPRTYVLSKAQYASAYGQRLDFRLPLPKALRQVYISGTLVFLGCSLEKDRTLELFATVTRQSQYEIPMHYAILAVPEGTPDKQRQNEERLLKLNIQPIWYPAGKHDYVEKLLQLAVDVADRRMALSS